MACSSSGPGRSATDPSSRWPRREAGPILQTRQRRCDGPAIVTAPVRMWFEPHRIRWSDWRARFVVQTIARSLRLRAADSWFKPHLGNCWFKPHLGCPMHRAGPAALVLPARAGGALWSCHGTAGGARLKDARCPQNASHFGSPTRRLRRSASPILDPVSTDAWRAFVHSRRRRFS